MKRPFTIVELVFVLAILAALLFPVAARSRSSKDERTQCYNNLKNIGLGFQMYTRDNDEKFPRVASGGEAFGWADALGPYMKSKQIFQCPAEANNGQSNPRAAGYTDYWFNSRLSGLDQNKLQGSWLTIINGDGNDGTDLTDARYVISGLSTAWRNDKNSPLYRHLDGAYYAFVDGHVKWHKPTRIQNNAPAESGLPTFNWK